MSHPRGFFKVYDKVLWATGREYTRDGNNPWRTEVLYQHGPHLFLSYEGDGALTDRASEREVAEWLGRLEVAQAARKKEIEQEARATCAAMDAILRTYREYAAEESRPAQCTKEKP